MVHCAQQAGGRVRGIVWYQGESDANDKDAPTYLQRFGEALAAWRAALGDPDLPIITAQLNRVTQALMSEAGWTQVREAQRQAARRLKSVAVVPTLDLPLSDLIHNSPPGNMLLAERMARAALGMVYGRPVDYRNDIRALTRYIFFPSWDDLLHFMRTHLEPVSKPAPD